MIVEATQHSEIVTFLEEKRPDVKKGRTGYKFDSPNAHLVVLDVRSLRSDVLDSLQNLSDADSSSSIFILKENVEKIQDFFKTLGQKIVCIEDEEDFYRLILDSKQLQILFENLSVVPISLGSKRIISESYHARSKSLYGIDQASHSERDLIISLRNLWRQNFLELFQLDNLTEFSEHLAIMRQGIIRHEYEHLQQQLEIFSENAKLSYTVPDLKSKLISWSKREDLKDVVVSKEYKKLVRLVKQIFVFCEIKAKLVEFRKEGSDEICQELFLIDLAKLLETFKTSDTQQVAKTPFEMLLSSIDDPTLLNSEHFFALLLILSKDLNIISEWDQEQSINIINLGKKVLHNIELALHDPQSYLDSISPEFLQEIDRLLLGKISEMEKTRVEVENLVTQK